MLECLILGYNKIMNNLQISNLFALLAKFAAFGYSLGVLVHIKPSFTVWVFWLGLQLFVFLGEIFRFIYANETSEN